MPIMFYQSNFCPECGNRHEHAQTQRQWLQHRYFCQHCAARLGHRWDWVPIAIAIGGLTIGMLFYFGRRPVVVNQVAALPVSNAAATILSPVSAQDATAQLKPAKVAQSVTTYPCGARTQKGRPCKHRVAAEGLRCFQHQGMPALKR